MNVDFEYGVYLVRENGSLKVVSVYDASLPDENWQEWWVGDLGGHAILPLELYKGEFIERLKNIEKIISLEQKVVWEEKEIKDQSEDLG